MRTSLQCVAVCCSVLQCGAVRHSELQCVVEWHVIRLLARLGAHGVAQRTHDAVQCSVRQHDAVRCSVSQREAVRCSGLQDNMSLVWPSDHVRTQSHDSLASCKLCTLLSDARHSRIEGSLFLFRASGGIRIGAGALFEGLLI